MDFVVRAGRTHPDIEVESGRTRDARAGLGAFTETFRRARPLLVGGDEIPVEEFLRMPVERWMES